MSDSYVNREPTICITKEEFNEHVCQPYVREVDTAGDFYLADWEFINDDDDDDAGSFFGEVVEGIGRFAGGFLGGLAQAFSDDKKRY